ncbi:MAG: hypothetical protein RR382_09565 [Tannerellaceae bacterium]
MNKLIILFCFVSFSVFGQNVSKYYVANHQSDGILYFIYPLSLFEERGNGDLTIDITYKTKSDSATVNFTYCQKGMTVADSVSFNGTSGLVISGIPQNLYLEAKKLPNWEHRYSLTVPFKQLSSLFASKSSFNICIYSQGKQLIYSPKRGWEKHANIIHTILDMAQL